MTHRRISMTASVAYNTATDEPTLAEFEELQEAFRDVFKRLCPGSCVSMDLTLSVEERAFTKQSVFTIGIKDLKPTLTEEVLCQASEEKTVVTNPPEESKLTVGQSIPIHPEIQVPGITITPDYGQPLIPVPEHSPTPEQQIQIMEAITRVREIGNMLDQMRPIMEAIPGIRSELKDLNVQLLASFRNG